MPKKLILLSGISLLVTLQACLFPHRSYVASSFEPVTVKKKGDLEINGSIRPMKFFKSNATLAVTDHIAVRAGYSGFFGLKNIDASCIFFKNYKWLGFFFAPTYNYQNNAIKRKYSFSFWGTGKSYTYNCEYHSPGLVLGLNLFSKRNNSHQLIVKGSYNIVSRYKYYYSSNTASGRDSGYYVQDDETLSVKIPNFFSVEPSYSFITGINRNLSFRLQVGLNFWQTVFRHAYTFQTKSYGGPPTQDAVRFHPVSFPLNVSVGLVVRHSFRKTPALE